MRSAREGARSAQEGAKMSPREPYRTSNGSVFRGGQVLVVFLDPSDIALSTGSVFRGGQVLIMFFMVVKSFRFLRFPLAVFLGSRGIPEEP